jgi:histidinol-phosphate aminotransferase
VSEGDGRHDLGPLARHVPPALQAFSAYHVPQPPGIVAKLDANELPYAVPAELREGLGRAVAAVALERYPDPTARELRELVAKEHGVAGDQIVFGNGSDETIAFLVAAFGAPRVAREHGHGGSRPAAVLYPVPSFVYYRMAAIAHQAEPIEVPLTARFELDEDAIERAIETHRPSVAFFALPNNPTGTLWRMEFVHELARRHRDLVVVSDEAYHAYSGRSSLEVLPQHENLVVMRTLSKVGMAGVRVGYTISSPAIAHLLEKVRPPYNLSSIDQRAACYMLEHGQTWCNERAAEVVAERAQLADGFARLPGVEVFPSAANLLLVRFADGRSQAIWQGLIDRGIIVRSFGNAGPLAGCLRFTVGTPEQNRLVLKALTDLVHG